MFVLTRQRLAIISSLVILIWMGVGIFVYKSSFPFPEEKELLNPASHEQEVKNCRERGQKLSPGFWRKVNLHKEDIPHSVKDSAATIVVQSESVTVQGVKVHYIYTTPKQENSIPVLLLHGQSFTSETWNELGTIRLLSALGHNPVAVDLPGFGKTPIISDINKLNFMDNLIKGLNLQKPVLVSPSMSGSFSLKYLLEYPDKLGGFIPVSPVGTSILSDAICKDHHDDSITAPLNDDCKRIMHYLKSDRPNLNCIKVPLLTVWGERDRGDNSARLCLLPESQGAEIPDGKHPAYLTNPDLWHKLLFNFLNMLNATRTCT